MPCYRPKVQQAVDGGSTRVGSLGAFRASLAVTPWEKPRGRPRRACKREVRGAGGARKRNKGSVWNDRGRGKMAGRMNVRITHRPGPVGCGAPNLGPDKHLEGVGRVSQAV